MHAAVQHHTILVKARRKENYPDPAAPSRARQRQRSPLIETACNRHGLGLLIVEFNSNRPRFDLFSDDIPHDIYSEAGFQPATAAFASAAKGVLR